MPVGGWEGGGGGGENPGLVRVGPAVDRPVGPPARPGRVRYFLAPARRRGVAVGRGASTHAPRAPASPTMPARTPPPDDPAPAAAGSVTRQGGGEGGGEHGWEGRGATAGQRRPGGQPVQATCSGGERGSRLPPSAAIRARGAGDRHGRHGVSQKTCHCWTAVLIVHGVWNWQFANSQCQQTQTYQESL